ncbi:alpha/beta fold hydrolase [Actinomycetospora sp. TBRC 11914]|uniref:alpha/beta fold hydrolase n=1 Tax=Actinomycetospora sp. TBRC 11914 TaxID=2729387 RepID=UPI00145CF8D2|nr:alpha/beta fold hydrolase [Actinomycetospora sp. TBRC 11914]NMO88415.1 alpha/beta fold hydrolase [Actinomycetospora sp. TBRC 11914]
MTTTETAEFHDWLPGSFTLHRVATHGTTLAVAVGGHGPTLVLLHGWPQTGRAWRRVLPALAEHHTLVVPDLRGAGDSDLPDDGYRKTEQVRDLRGVLEALGLTGPSVVVGHDIGGMIALAWAAEFPDEVAALVVLDVVFPGLGLEEAMDVARGGMWHFGFFMQPGVPEMLFDGHELEFFTDSFTALSNPGTFTDADLAWYARAYRGRERLRAGFAQYRDLLADGADNRSLLAGRPLAMPVLAVGGGGRMGHAVADALRAHAPRLTDVVAPTGHFVAEEEPDWFVATLTGFLAREAGDLTRR